jgi:hypothetical protein
MVTGLQVHHMAARFKTWDIFARSKAGIVSSNPTQGMDVCVRLFCVCADLWVGSGLATSWSPVQGVLLTVYSITKLKKALSNQQKAVEPLTNDDWISLEYIYKFLYDKFFCPNKNWQQATSCTEYPIFLDKKKYEEAFEEVRGTR